MYAVSYTDMSREDLWGSSMQLCQRAGLYPLLDGFARWSTVEGTSFCTHHKHLSLPVFSARHGFLGDKAVGLDLLVFFLSYKFLSFNLDFFHFSFKIDL